MAAVPQNTRAGKRRVRDYRVSDLKLIGSLISQNTGVVAERNAGATAIRIHPMQTYTQSFICALLLGVLTSCGWAQVIRLEEFKPAKDGMPGEREYRNKIEIGPGVQLDVTVDVTARGNGALRVANLNLRVLDEYDDGAVYVGGLLHVEFLDITGDGFKDLVIMGTVIHTGEKETDPRSYEAVTSIYVFDPKKKEFRLAFHCGPQLDY